VKVCNASRRRADADCTCVPSAGYRTGDASSSVLDFSEACFTVGTIYLYSSVTQGKRNREIATPHMHCALPGVSKT